MFADEAAAAEVVRQYHALPWECQWPLLVQLAAEFVRQASGGRVAFPIHEPDGREFRLLMMLAEEQPGNYQTFAISPQTTPP